MSNSIGLQAELDQAQMLVVGDIDDMFVPLSRGFLVDAWESRFVIFYSLVFLPRTRLRQDFRTLIESLLDSLPNMFAENTVMEAALGGALGAVLSALVRFVLLSNQNKTADAPV
jgi:protein transport protein SEC24